MSIVLTFEHADALSELTALAAKLPDAVLPETIAIPPADPTLSEVGFPGTIEAVDALEKVVTDLGRANLMSAKLATDSRSLLFVLRALTDPEYQQHVSACIAAGATRILGFSPANSGVLPDNRPPAPRNIRNIPDKRRPPSETA